MADLTISVKEQILLDGTERGTEYRHVISDITSIDNRILTAPSGSEITVFSFGGDNSAGTFITSSFKYGRITNLSKTTPLNLKVSSSNELMSFNIAAEGSFMLSSTQITGSSFISGSVSGSASPLDGYDNIVSIKVEPSGSDARLEYFVATL